MNIFPHNILEMPIGVVIRFENSEAVKGVEVRIFSSPQGIVV